MENKPTYKIPAENLGKLQAQIDQINKRVARLVKRGYPVKPVVIKVGPPIIEKKPVEGEYDAIGCPIYRDRVCYNVELESPEPPRANGWEFVAALSHVEDVGTVLRVIPGAKVEEGELKQFRNASPENCDHCHTKRKRNDTFILRKV